MCVLDVDMQCVPLISEQDVQQDLQKDVATAFARGWLFNKELRDEAHRELVQAKVSGSLPQC